MVNKISSILFGMICLLLPGCSEEDKSGQVHEALTYLQLRQVSHTRGANEEWQASKHYLGLPFSRMDRTSYVQINDDRTISFFNITEDCAHETDGIRALQYSSGVWSDITFSKIWRLRASEGEIDEEDLDLYYMSILLSEDIQIFTDWFTCTDEPIGEYEQAQTVRQSIVFTFTDEFERDEYMRYMQVLMDLKY